PLFPYTTLFRSPEFLVPRERLGIRLRESGDLLLIRREIGAIQQVPPIRERMEQRGIVGMFLQTEGGQVQVSLDLGAQEATDVRERRDVEPRLDLFRHAGAADDRR